MHVTIRYFATLIIAGTIAACGGGSGGAGSTGQAAPPPAAVATKATVGIILTDASIEDYDHAYVTISSVELIGNSDHELVFSGNQRVDLLALRDNVEVFAVSEDVEPGDYSKIRMQASGMELVVDHDDGSTTSTPVDLVANGKIDLNPRGEFSLAAGDVVFLSLDWDMSESLKLTETGKGNGKMKMRPVIFVDVGTHPAFKEGLVRVFGQISIIASDSSVFRLCSPDVMTQLPTTPILGSLCLDVIINDKTGIFDANGDPVSVTDLGLEAPVTVVGLLQRGADGPTVTPMQNTSGDVTPTTFQVISIVVEGGGKGTWSRVRGTVKSLVAADTGQFDFLVDNVEDPDNAKTLTGQLFDESRIFSISAVSGIAEIGAADLSIDDRAGADAVLKESGDETVADTLNISLLLSRTPGDVEPDHLKGEILSIDAAAGTMMVTSDSGDLLVTTDADTKIFELFVHNDVVESVPATLADLSAGSKIAISGAPDAVTGSFAAVLIIAEGQATTTP
jgi:hypothetical protein